MRIPYIKPIIFVHFEIQQNLKPFFFKKNKFAFGPALTYELKLQSILLPIHILLRYDFKDY